MSLRSLVRLLFVVCLLQACAGPRKVTLAPVSVVANAPGAHVYRGSYTKYTDILHTKLDLKFNWDSAFVIGKAQITAKPHFYPSDRVHLDATGFRINAIELLKNDENIPLKYTYDGRLLTIFLDKSYSRNQQFKLMVDYTAMPAKLQIGKDIASEDYRGFYFINPGGQEKDKPRQIWTQGETEYNSSWFPTINDPQEKMTQEISLTVPDYMTTLSNGSLDFSTFNADGTRTDTWRQEQPHSTYLAMVAAGNFKIIKDSWRGKEVNYYIEPPYTEHAKLIFGKTPEMMEFFSKKLGVDYPWDKYSQIVVRDFTGGGMENTTATVLFEGMNMSEGRYLDENHEDLISHELFHHWFGNLVTCKSWANIPLNESFATYGEYLWNEYKYGRDYADFKGMQDRERYLSDPKSKGLNVIRFNYADKEQMFDDVSYQKGGQIIHMLRKVVGDDAFFQALKLYLTRHAYKSVEIHDLRLAFEEVSGRDLNWFFNQWFLASGNPVLDIQTSFDAANKLAKVTIVQKQDLSQAPLYKLPMLIDIYTDSKTEHKEVVLEKQVQTFTFPVSEEPQLINVDAERSILAEKKESKSLAQYIFQYEKAPLFMDRFEAIVQLRALGKEKSARATLIKALGDKNWYIRQMAVDFIPSLDKEEKEQVYEKVKQLAVKDDRSYVRAAAITTLKTIFSAKNNEDVYKAAAQDKAISVQRALAGSNIEPMLITP